MAQDNKRSFMKGAAILSASTLIVKLLGLLFSIPLANFVAPEGMSHFYIAYNIFGLFLMLSTAGLPVAVSRMVGTAYAQGRRREADRVFSVAFWLFFLLGLFGCLVMFFGADQIAQWYSSPDSNYAIMALAPTLFFISLESSLRGYFQGRSNMVPTATSQIIEAVTKVIIGVGLAFYIIQNVSEDPDRWAAVGAIVGVSISAALGAMYLLGFKAVQSRRDKKGGLGGGAHPHLPQADADEPDPLRGSHYHWLPAFKPCWTRWDGPSCWPAASGRGGPDPGNGRLVERYHWPRPQVLRFAGGFCGAHLHQPSAHPLGGHRLQEPAPGGQDFLHGPAGDAAHRGALFCGHGHFRKAHLPAAAVQPARGGGRGRPPADHAQPGHCLSGLLFTTNAILQSFGRATRPVIDMAVGGVVKIVLSYVLIGIPQVAAMGSAISTVVSYVVMVVLNVFALRSSLPKMDSVVKTALPLVLASAVMGAVSYGAYWLLTWVVSPRVAVIPAILVAILVYALCAVLFRGVGYEDVAALPKGHTLARLLRMKPEEPARRREAPLPAEELPLEKAASSGAASEERKAPPARKAPSRGRGKYVPRHMR